MQYSQHNATAGTCKGLVETIIRQCIKVCNDHDDHLALSCQIADDDEHAHRRTIIVRLMVITMTIMDHPL